MGHVCADIKSWLENQPGLLKAYSYDFDLGKSKMGSPLGGGKVDIYYYDDEAFIRMQNWEPYVIEHAFNLGKFDGDIDLLHADIPPLLRRHYKNVTDRGISAYA
ncbi:hypothetical protein, partial [Klebsiella pneumoniae]|uniref:hypothetical protein n=1 Tax=Klebsiella pneumoniae TaxID=573 RepID=UPI001C1F98B8